MATNNEVLNDIWIKTIEQEIACKAKMDSKEEIWGKPLYYTLAAITDYLCNTEEEETQDSNRERLEFSAKYLEFLPQIKPERNQLFGDEELLLFSATAYTFAGHLGMSSIVLKNLKGSKLSPIEKILAEVLNYGQTNYIWGKSEIAKTMMLVLSGDKNFSDLMSMINQMIAQAYSLNNDVDIVAAECIRKVAQLCWENATVNLMPKFSNINVKKWHLLVTQKKVYPVLWKAQCELGKQGVYSGNSAVVQLPTGSGKTTSFSLILRSYLFRETFHVAVVVVPFKSIRDEIYHDLYCKFENEEVEINCISSEPIIDTANFSLEDRPSILIVTPEKLLFIIRHEPKFLNDVGLFIFDEAHQLDNGKRGITFELLLSTIDLLTTEKIQKIFVSAVIGNPEDVSTWFNAGNNCVVKNLKPRKFARILGYAFWGKYSLCGKLLLWNELQKNNDWIEFPKFFKPIKIKKGKLQPNFKTKNCSMAIKWTTVLTTVQFLNSGMVAVYAPRTDSITSISKVFIQLQEQDRVKSFKSSCGPELSELFALNFGENTALVNAYRHGIYIHDGNIPDGIRNALEYEARKGNISLLLCTNTLAQGVNLPIKTIIITSVGNGILALNNRDIINLVGRVGRSGILNDGNIIFMRNSSKSANEHTKCVIEKLVHGVSADSLKSSLGFLFEPTPLDPYSKNSKMIQPNDWCVEEFLDNPLDWIDKKIKKSSSNKVQLLESALISKANGIWKIENYLMSVWDVIQKGNLEKNIDIIVERTFAATVIEKRTLELIRKTFKYLAQKISTLVSDQQKILAFGKMMVGIDEALNIEHFEEEYGENILQVDSLTEMIKDIWPVLRNSIPRNYRKNEAFYRTILTEWVQGKSYAELLITWKNTYSHLQSGKRKPNIERIYKICNQLFQYDMQLKVASLMEVVDDSVKQQRLKRLQEAMKIGLPSITEQFIYQLGINDRVLAHLIFEDIGCKTINSKEKVLIEIRKKRQSILEKYSNCFPEYYFLKLSNL